MTGLCVSDQGEVVGWGNSEYGQFGAVTDEQQLATPTNLRSLRDSCGKIIDVACGGTVCIVLNGISTASKVFCIGLFLFRRGYAICFGNVTKS